MTIRKVVLVVLLTSALFLSAGIGQHAAKDAIALPAIAEDIAAGTTIPYLGHLHDMDGAPVADGLYDFAFSLYDVTTDGTALWSEVHEGVLVKSGGVAILLGETAPIPSSLLADGAQWLAVGVRGAGEADFTTLNPRQQFSANLSVASASVTGLTCAHDHWGERWNGNGLGLSISSNSMALLANSTSSAAITGKSANNYGVHGQGGNVGVFGEATGADTDSTGVYGLGTKGVGVYGVSTGAAGVRGDSENENGVFGTSVNEHGVYGRTYGDYGWRSGVFGMATGDHANGVTGWNDFAGVGVYGKSENGWAGYFNGKVNVTGSLTKGGGAFKIDHPLDPENRYLYHSFVESPDMKNIYDGLVELDASGEAWVTLPAWFESLNETFRYQLTPLGVPGPNLHVAQEIQDNRFQIAGGEPDMRVSWQVTGIRHDAFAEANRFPVEEEKPDGERGTYIYPVEHGQPEATGLDYQRVQELSQGMEGGG